MPSVGRGSAPDSTRITFARPTAVQSYLEAAKYLRHILWSDTGPGELPPGYRISVLRTYLRIKARQMFAGSQQTNELQRETLFTFRLSIPDFDWFVFLFEELFIDRSYWFRSTRPSPSIIDCGSNVGMSVLFFKWFYPSASILAFEADPDTFSVLQRNVGENRLMGVTLVNKVIHDHNGSVSFFRSSDELGSPLNTAIESQRHGQDAMVSLPSVVLSDFIEDEVDFLKVDIEGSEGLVLDELAASGKLSRIRELVLEHGSHLSAAAAPLCKLLSTLETHGFEYRVKQGSPWQWNAPMQHQNLLIHARRK